MPSGGEEHVGPKVVSKVLGIAVGKHRPSLGLSDRERGLHANKSRANSDHLLNGYTTVTLNPVRLPRKPMSFRAEGQVHSTVDPAWPGLAWLQASYIHSSASSGAVVVGWWGGSLGGQWANL